MRSTIDWQIQSYGCHFRSDPFAILKYLHLSIYTLPHRLRCSTLTLQTFTSPPPLPKTTQSKPQTQNSTTTSPKRIPPKMKTNKSSLQSLFQTKTSPSVFQNPTLESCAIWYLSQSP